MVFRRLNQLVPEFSNFILSAAGTLGVDPVLLGARLVGRWKSGAPLALTPSQDDTTLGADPNQNNNFDFSDDQGERRCPYAAHIRKTNPRADFDQGGLSQEQAVDPRRVIRAGFVGPEVSPTEQSANTTSQERGLMFVCYQTSIPDQFEFLQISWANKPNFISDGIPPSIKEASRRFGGQGWLRSYHRSEHREWTTATANSGRTGSELPNRQRPKHPPGTSKLYRPNRGSVFLRALHRGAGERVECLACTDHKSFLTRNELGRFGPAAAPARQQKGSRANLFPERGPVLSPRFLTLAPQISIFLLRLICGQPPSAPPSAPPIA